MSDATESHSTGEELFSKLASVAKEKNSPELGSLTALTKVLNIAFAHLNHMEIVFDEKNEQSFVVKTEEKAGGHFPRRLFKTPNTRSAMGTYKETGFVSLPIFDMKVILGPSFNVVTDLPKLIAEVQKKHNEQMAAYQQQEPMVFIDTSRQLANYWQFMSAQLRQFIADNREKLNSIKDLKQESNVSQSGENIFIHRLETFAKLYELIAQGFIDTKAEIPLAQEVDTTPVLQEIWQPTREYLDKLLNSTLVKAERQQKNLKTVSTPISKFLQLTFQVLEKINVQNILSELNTQASLAFFHHCQAELFRKAGLGELFERLDGEENHDPAELTMNKDSFRDNKFDENHHYVRWLRNEFPRAEAELTKIGNKISKLKQELNQKKDPADKRQCIYDLTDTQIFLALKLCALVYSENFFLYDKDKYSFSDAIEQNYVNCVSIAELLYQLWKKYAGETTFAAMSKGHFFSVAKLANGQFLSLDIKPNIFVKNFSTYELGEHEKLYQAALFDWKANELQEQGLDSQAEALYKEALRLAPNNPFFKINFATLLMNNPKRHPEAEMLFKEALMLAPNDPWVITVAARFYSKATIPLNTSAKKRLALDYYYKALKIMRADPNAENFLTVETIEALIGQIEKLPSKNLHNT